MKKWLKDRGNRDLIADSATGRGWEFSTVMVLDCSNTKWKREGDIMGTENTCMRAISCLVLVKLGKT